MPPYASWLANQAVILSKTICKPNENLLKQLEDWPSQIKLVQFSVAKKPQSRLGAGAFFIAGPPEDGKSTPSGPPCIGGQRTSRSGVAWGPFFKRSSKCFPGPLGAKRLRLPLAAASAGGPQDHILHEFPTQNQHRDGLGTVCLRGRRLKLLHRIDLGVAHRQDHIAFPQSRASGTVSG